MPTSTISVIIPVRNMSAQVAKCVVTIAEQLGPGDEVLVVDDGSTDDTAAHAEQAGARVIRNTGGKGGPYGARNFGVTQSANDFLLFIDGRSRGRAGLLDAHRALLSSPGVALSCTGVQVEKGPSLAARIAVSQDGFRLDTRALKEGYNFFPTANLGVTRSAFQAVHGFRAIRSGADADLCWRVQLAGLGGLAADSRELMSWEPRNKITDLMEQNFRYGRSSVLLDKLYADNKTALAGLRAVDTPASQGPPSPKPAPDRLAEFGAQFINVVFRAGRLKGSRDYRAIQAGEIPSD